MVRPAVRIGEAPPALGQTKHDIDPASPLGALDQQQCAARRQQLGDMREALLQVLRRVQDVRREHNIERGCREALLARRAVEVEEARLQFLASEFFWGGRKKTGGE